MQDGRESKLQDATYVDDEALYLAHASPIKLAQLIHKLFVCVRMVFKRFGIPKSIGAGAKHYFFSRILNDS